MGITVNNQATAKHNPVDWSSKGPYGPSQMMPSSSIKNYGRI